MDSSDPIRGEGNPLRAKLLSGERLHFKRDKRKEERTLQAEWLVEAAGKPVRIDVQNAVIQGVLNLRYVTFEEEVSLTSCEIVELADFSHTTFKRELLLRGTTFNHGANFTNALVERNAHLSGTKFLGGMALFSDLHVCGVFNAKKMHFSSGVITNFNRARFDKSVFFNKSIFEEGADFVSIQIGSQANFEETQFTSKNKLVSFAKAEIRGDASFTGSRFVCSAVYFEGARFGAIAFFNSDPDRKLPAAVFEGNVHFGRVQIASNAVFIGTVFKGEVNFNQGKIGGSIFCRSGSIFEGKANFSYMVIGSSAEFQGAIFKKQVTLEKTEIASSAFFWNAQFLQGSKPIFFGTNFRGGAYFLGAKFKDDVNFVTAQFQEADFSRAVFDAEAKFDASQFTGLARFRGSVFGRITFEHARFEHDARFDDVLFQGETSFRETFFQGVYFSPKGLAQGKKQFQGSVDLRGCVYERVEVDRKSLLEHLAPYDRQPYTQLEKVFRAVGQDGEADEVYLERRRVERQLLSFRRVPFRWFGAWLYKWVANYGVRPYRLIGIPLILLVLGAIVFSRPLAMEMNADKQPAELAQSKAPIRNNTDAPTQRREDFTGWDALRLSIRLFLPVEVPLATRWKTSDKPFGPLRFSDYATLLKLAGWVLVPLGIAALTGLLRRVAP